jgi:ubiquitin-conjugating enzyme E2 Q
MSTNDDAPLLVASILEDCSHLEGLELKSAVEKVAKSIRSQCIDQDGDTQMIDSGIDDNENASDIEDCFYTDEELGFSTRHPNNFQDFSQVAGTYSIVDEDMKHRICRDLALVKEAGFKVGIHGNIFSTQRCYVCVSILIAKLGLSEEAMGAWNVKSSQYLVLAISYANGYKAMDQVFDNRHNITFKVGLSGHYKPTLRDVVSLFQPVQPGQPGLESQTSQVGKLDENSSTRWLTCFISAPLEELLNERFILILKNRNAGMPWRGAENFYHDTQGITMHADEFDYDMYLKEDTVKRAYPEIIERDHVLDGDDTSRSFPLITVQFLLRHFVRCTEFCLVCHCSVDSDLEAIKPYVCNRPLCLYQYMSLGFGPEIEHEIKTQPYVVDLLISFCWQSAKSGKLKEFPTGLSLSIPDESILQPIEAAFNFRHALPSRPPSRSEQLPNPSSVEEVQFNPMKNELIYSKSSEITLREGDWVMLKEPKTEEQDEIRHHRVLSVSHRLVKLSALPLHTNMHVKYHGSIGSTKADSNVLVNVYRYKRNFDSLTDAFRRAVILNQIDLLPSVNEMKQWLEAHPRSNLSKWKDKISPTALAILRWIIASNRSCIVGVDEPERVRGMNDWIQFRFAMGAPVRTNYLESIIVYLFLQDKEQRFIDAVNDLVDQNSEVKHSTIFAWHGSPLANWHSIIREGLHYNYVSSGRAFGDGVYHSLDYNTSRGYTNTYFNSSANSAWPKSMIGITSSICLSEIVNSPGEFVSQTPHIVIDKLDWIQTRYLFVKGSKSESDHNHNEPTALPTLNPLPASMIFAQDPKWTPTGSTNGEKITIPRTAIPRSRRPKILQPVIENTVSSRTSISSSSSSSHHRTGTIISGIFKRQKVELNSSKDSTEVAPVEEFIDLTKDEDAISVVTLDEDLEIFANYDSKKSTPRFTLKFESRLRRLFGGKEHDDVSKPAQEMKPTEPISSTNFEPGKLYYKRLPLLPAPTDAALGTTKQLLSQFNALKKTQDSTPQHELGWYTDPNQFENPFQWIVELHSFPAHLPLTKQMQEQKIPSVVLEIRFPTSYPFTPPFIRVIRPRFLSFASGGGGHVTVGGSLCMELLTSDGWLATYDLASVLFQVRLAICSEDPRPAQLEKYVGSQDYGIYEAVDAYVRACNAHGWRVPEGFKQEIRAMDSTVTVTGVGSSKDV